ncbi:hypothetical protein [Streptomyces liliifuscus]|uniref:Uncharacterized protein n=1 Tax=Streptomyces liliifuscus TaxID=2797636 RepID=A0A7T7RI06_9ACTN|nr:hypothetical protein [Streptomyces liliifuscus]QQM47428.1 hypothetical protein JEQ17_48540 [Streptomyces liliifuscus]
MSSRTQRRHRGAWWTTPVAALCPALAVLLAALVMCLGYAAHNASDQAAAPMATMSATAAQTTPSATHHVKVIAHQADCPAGDVCCDPVAHGVRAVLAAPTQPPPAILPPMPSPPRSDTPSCSTDLPPTRGAPDLHVLQVQRT